MVSPQRDLVAAADTMHALLIDVVTNQARWRRDLVTTFKESRYGVV
jgi:hypothetical protein